MNQAYNQFKSYKIEDQSMVKKWKATGESEGVKAVKKDIEESQKAEEMGLSRTQLAFYNQLITEGNYEMANELVKANHVRATASRYPSTQVGWDNIKHSDPSLYFSHEATEARKLAMKDFAKYHSKN